MKYPNVQSVLFTCLASTVAAVAPNSSTAAPIFSATKLVSTERPSFEQRLTATCLAYKANEIGSRVDNFGVYIIENGDRPIFTAPAMESQYVYLLIKEDSMSPVSAEVLTRPNSKWIQVSVGDKYSEQEKGFVPPFSVVSAHLNNNGSVSIIQSDTVAQDGTLAQGGAANEIAARRIAQALGSCTGMIKPDRTLQQATWTQKYQPSGKYADPSPDENVPPGEHTPQPEYYNMSSRSFTTTNTLKSASPEP
ncbi:MAG: hypothetical protein PHD48_03815 [Alphaproteobacteria bacterium]|nr:hypothetical protein [Alphaproteobacteria bacterium]